jgi:AraC-like DNA-binding protein
MARIEPADEAVVGRPNGPLRQYVREHHGYRQRGVEPARHLGLPSPFLTVIFTLDEPLEIARHPDPRQHPDTYPALIGGLHSSPALVVHDGAQSGIQLQVSPLAARPLFGVPAGELSSLDVQAEDVLGPLAAEVHQQVRDAGNWPARFAVLDRVLGRALDADRDVPAEVARAWALLLRTGGTMPIRDIARAVGWSERHLGTRFAREIGLRPKTAARVIRFDRARRVVQRNAGAGRPNIAGAAAECGYFDQAHLIRDWQQFTGLAPTEWIAHEFRNFQALAVAPPASSTA